MNSINKKTICLNMIVKNESHIIVNTLKHISKYIKFDYWVISDTGSTDSTKEDIKKYFDEVNIPGELIETPWKDFGYNRTVALNNAYKKTDYVFVWDADDEIVGDFELPKNLTGDAYKFIFGNPNGLRYCRCQLFNNHKKWAYIGVLHEYAKCLEPSQEPIDVIGNYYFISGHIGDRSRDPNKYAKDAIILEKAFHEAFEKKDPIYNRYCFYTAQSYNSSNNPIKAIEYYKQVLPLNGWLQEKYYSCLEIYEQYQKLKTNEQEGLYYLVESFKYDKHRIECIYRLVRYYCIKEMPEIAYAYYTLIKVYYETQYIYDDISNYLFANKQEYDFYFPYYMIIIGERTKNFDTVIKMYYIIFKKKFVNTNQWWINNLFNNIQFIIPYLSNDITFLELMLNYIICLREKNIILNNQNNKIVDLIINKYRPFISSYSENIIKNLGLTKLNETVLSPVTFPLETLGLTKLNVTTMLTITTCKRFDLFEQTINSMTKMWTDINKIDYFLCVDDNSSDEDRLKMQEKFPFFNYYMKSPEEKGHRESMNIIWNKLNEIKPTYWIHMEDDWLYFKSNNFITRGIQLLEKYKDKNIHQLVFNRTYGLMMSDMNRVGGIPLEPGILLHEKKENVMGPNCAYWPHYSLQPSIVRTSVILELGNYDSANSFFERDYANKYHAKGYQTMFYDFIYSLHIGKQHWEKEGKNAYALNEIDQFKQSSKPQALDLNGYKSIFDRSINIFKNKTKDNITLFNSFRSETDIYGFIDNGDAPCDKEAETIAKQKNLEMFNMYQTNLSIRKKLGYDNSTSVHSDYTNLDSRHIMMSILLFSEIKEKISTIVEIGGGFGNWLTLNRTQQFDKWTIIDLPHLGLLQNWYLEEQNIDKFMYETVSALDYDEWNSKQESIDVVIGSHSLSELSFEDFNAYFEKVISKAKYLFYCYHNTRPSPELINNKLMVIEYKFTLLSKTLSEGGNTSNCLYQII